jgi:pimeloyl-ACP methyl ester carboxylesterase
MAALVPVPVVAAACSREARVAAHAVRCGFARVPLDHANPGGRSIRIYFERYRRSELGLPPASTVVAIEGGPGYSSTASRDGYLRLWRPVSRLRDLVLVDLRGTGRSGALTCAAFAKSTVAYARRGGRCAAQLGPDRDLYTTAQSVDDLDDVLQALGVARVDLYGDSYGSFAAQAFAVRHPTRLRSLVLDSTYPVTGTDPAGSDLIAAVRRGLRLSCARRPGCPARSLAMDPVALVAQFSARLKRTPIMGVAPDGDGNPTHVRLDQDAFVQLVSASYSYFGVWRDVEAAIVSAEAGDNAPILRLAAETVTVDGGAASPTAYSDPLYLAVTCHDYPQLWDPLTSLGDRRAEVLRRLALYPAGTFAPFTGLLWTGVDYEGFLACLDWPAAPDAGQPVPPGAEYPDVPTLVLSGDLDTITAASGARVVASRFPHGTFVDIHNSIHVTAIYDRDSCASTIYTRFVGTLRAGDTSCASRIAEVRLVPTFARSLAKVTPARPLPGDKSAVADRQLAAATAATVADAMARWQVNYDGSSVGLRGGSWSYTGTDIAVFKLKDASFVPGVTVSGTARWNVYGGQVTATVTANGRAHLRLRWSLHEQHGLATITGDASGRAVRATMLAP